MLRGGGVAFGPKPRDFGTGLPRKVYDIAWRTALSYRYRRGELIVVEDGMDIEEANGGLAADIFEQNGWGNAEGRSLLITADYRENLFEALAKNPTDGKVLSAEDVDVKNILEMGRIVIEQEALDMILEEHQSDIPPSRQQLFTGQSEDYI
jgi:large subunit ribosomal protein L4